MKPYWFSLFLVSFFSGNYYAQFTTYRPPVSYHPTAVVISKQALEFFPLGSLSQLKGAKQVNIQYDYKSVQVEGFKTEEEFLERKKSKYANSGNPEKGDDFVNNWYTSRETVCEPKYELLFNKYSKFVTGVNYSKENEITVIVKPKFFQPGFMGPATKPTYMTFSVIFYNKNFEEFFRYNISGVKGTSFCNCVEMAGKVVGKRLSKDLKNLH